VEGGVENCVQRAKDLRQEADLLLARTSLLEKLSHHGLVEVTGSYAYDLLTRRDLDICLTMKSVHVYPVFEVGRTLAEIEGVGKLAYRNELVLETEGNPVGVFWGLTLGGNWPVEILLAESTEVRRIVDSLRDLLLEITEEQWLSILRIKSALTGHPGYRTEFKSTDIYEAVVREGVSDLDGWWARR
jgi:hypothetical protein